MSIVDALLTNLPDEPRWVDVRGVLLSGGLIFGAREQAVAVSRNGKLVCLIGEPDRAVIAAALEHAAPERDLLADPKHAGSVGRMLGASGERAWLHDRVTAASAASETAASETARIMLATDRIDPQSAPKKLIDELRQARRAGPVAASFEGDLPVAFCYPALETETLWDVAIDTLEPFRRSGHAAAAFGAMERLMQARGRRPVWGAVESNLASLALARKLGFEPVASIYIFESPATP